MEKETPSFFKTRRKPDRFTGIELVKCTIVTRRRNTAPTVPVVRESLPTSDLASYVRRWVSDGQFRHLSSQTLTLARTCPSACREHTIYPYLLRGIKAEKPNHIWGIDITYIRLATGCMYRTSPRSAEICSQVCERGCSSGLVLPLRRDLGIGSGNWIKLGKCHLFLRRLTVR